MKDAYKLVPSTFVRPFLTGNSTPFRSRHPQHRGGNPHRHCLSLEPDRLEISFERSGERSSGFRHRLLDLRLR